MQARARSSRPSPGSCWAEASGAARTSVERQRTGAKPPGKQGSTATLWVSPPWGQRPSAGGCVLQGLQTLSPTTTQASPE